MVNKPWESNTGGDIAKRQLTIGVMMSDGIVDPHPPIVRSLQETVRALEAAGHKVVPWEPLSHKEIVGVIVAMFLIDGGRKIRAELEKGGEEPLAFITMALSLGGAPRSIEEGWEVSYAFQLLM